MAHKEVQIPGPGHPITVEPNPGRVVVTVGGRVVADSGNALTLREATIPPVQYIPREDVDFSVLERTEHTTYCPFKGDAAYYSFSADGESVENGVWTYEAPYDAVAPIKDHVAFYATKFTIAEHA
ncbi:DUF427 domain-containing protein [Amycolatopsis sp. NPDC059027]|uniref:DUF427 domain-containing protein n=1 Tax=unclassified Amycolatopsis TaxID=2618356 RepID=UPI0036722CCC